MFPFMVSFYHPSNKRFLSHFYPYSLLALTFKLGMKKLSGLQKHSRYDVKSRIVDPDQGNIIATSSPGDSDKADALIVALVKMGFILAYFYVCDRTNFFMKENK